MGNVVLVSLGCCYVHFSFTVFLRIKVDFSLLIWFVVLQIEREREEHLLPRFTQSPEPEYPPCLPTDSAQTPDSDHSSGPLVIDQQKPPRMALTMHPVEPVRAAPEPAVRVDPQPALASAYSSPDPSENSRHEMSLPLPVVSDNSMSELSQNAAGGASRDGQQQQSKLGFSGLKLGKFQTENIFCRVTYS